MDSSSVLNFSANGERLMCGGFSLGETVCLRSFEFIADYFDGLSLSPKRGDSGTAFMGSTRSGPPSLWWAMIEDSNEEFHTASSGGGGSGLPSHKRLSMGALPVPVTTPPWQEDAPAIQFMLMVQPQVLAPWLPIGHSFYRWHTS
jgi:hypothetical protein